ncbi:GMC oxidoreductase [Rhizobium sp. BK251]|uniref:GMC oxidoreductase n=1 Tax=Rhizobium sp. BK251 TaxID=2512125 RepID=UPI001042D37F|nr:GMC oxidoreductase [Rhizobium sp. BK251]TCL74854.1 choline dehydrogenase-like flavoprotein [Rhizobium sp. BK251]
MTFSASTYVNFVSETGAAEQRLFLRYIGPRDDFDIIIVGSGMGGGILADDLADRLGHNKRILVLEAGSFVYPTHVYNLCRFSNASVARHFGCDTFWQPGDSSSQNYIGEKPQLNLGGRSIFWSGLIPSIQPWELEFFPPRVRGDLAAGLLDEAGETMNESRTLGATAAAVVAKLRQSPLANDFVIEETPRALHQPYLEPDGTPKNEFFTEPTGVFNTAELLINQLGLTPGVSHGDGPGLQLLLNSYVEDVQNHGDHFELVTRNTLTGQIRFFKAVTVVLAAGSLESPKLLRRSSMFPWFPDHAKALIGRGLTDHPTSNEVNTFVTNIGNVAIPRTDHAKIIFYSRGLRDGGQIRFPFNVEMNINHEYWHLRENDPNSPDSADPPPGGLAGPSRLDIKFSFGNPLDDVNEVKPAPPFGYVPEIAFRNMSWMDYLAGSRFPAVAGWHKNFDEIFAVMNDVTHRIFSQFQIDGQPARPEGEAWFGQQGKGFGWGTVHHSAGSLRMPYRPSLGANFDFASVVDEDLRVAGTQNLYVCDMSVMPFSSAANPVRTLAALALRLSRHFG